MSVVAHFLNYWGSCPHDYPILFAPVAESADARDLKSLGRNTIWVQIPSGVPF